MVGHRYGGATDRFQKSDGCNPEQPHHPWLATKSEGFWAVTQHSFPMAELRERIPLSHVRKTSHALFVAVNMCWASTVFSPIPSNLSYIGSLLIMGLLITVF